MLEKRGAGAVGIIITILFFCTAIFYVYYMYYLPSKDNQEKEDLSSQLNPARDLSGIWEGNAKWQNNVVNPACSYEGTIRFDLRLNGNQITGNWQTTITKSNQLLKTVPCSLPGENLPADLIGGVSSSKAKFSSGAIDFKGMLTSDLFKGTFESCPDQICSDGSRAVGFIGEYTTIRKR